MKKIIFNLVAYTDAAGKRDESAPNMGNEDNMFVDYDLSDDKVNQFVAGESKTLDSYGMLMAVADGMGGMNAGEVASDIAIKTITKFFKYDELHKHSFNSAADRVAYMENVVVEADKAIKESSSKNQEQQGMGSTIVMAWLCDGELSVTWCGDSRAYLYRDNEGLRQISKDHSYVQGLVDAGQITMEEAFTHPYSNVITRSLGDMEKQAVPDSITIPVYKNDIIMLCSDGLSGVLRDAELSQIIKENANSMQECREALWHAAEALWYDNVTAILCKIEEGEDLPVAEINQEIPSIEPTPVASKSFIQIKLSKKWIRACIVILCIVVVGILAWHYISAYLHEKECTSFIQTFNIAKDLIQKQQFSGALQLLDSTNIDTTCVCVDSIRRYVAIAKDSINAQNVAKNSDTIVVEKIVFQTVEKIKNSPVKSVSPKKEDSIEEDEGTSDLKPQETDSELKPIIELKPIGKKSKKMEPEPTKEDSFPNNNDVN